MLTGETTPSPPTPKVESRALRWRVPLIGGLPPILVIPALLVVLLMVSPLVYLLLRAGQAGTHLIDLLWRPRTLLLVRNSLLLTTTVTAAAVLIALPLA